MLRKSTFCSHFLLHPRTNNSYLFVFGFALICSHFRERMETLGQTGSTKGTRFSYRNRVNRFSYSNNFDRFNYRNRVDRFSYWTESTGSVIVTGSTNSDIGTESTGSATTTGSTGSNIGTQLTGSATGTGSTDSFIETGQTGSAIITGLIGSSISKKVQTGSDIGTGSTG